MIKKQILFLYLEENNCSERKPLEKVNPFQATYKYDFTIYDWFWQISNL